MLHSFPFSDLIPNQGVAGSSPAGVAKKINGLPEFCRLMRPMERRWGFMGASAALGHSGYGRFAGLRQVSVGEETLMVPASLPIASRTPHVQ
jgi:hypothetical protein